MESVMKLNKTFYELRKQSKVKHRVHRDYDQKLSQKGFVKKMEEIEEKIVKRINMSNYKLAQMIKKNWKYLSKENGKAFEIDMNFPRLNFEKVVK